MDDVLQKYLMEYILPQNVEAIVTLNPARLSTDVAGTVLGQKLAHSTDMLSKPFHNLEVGKNYLITSKEHIKNSHSTNFYLNFLYLIFPTLF